MTDAQVIAVMQAEIEKSESRGPRRSVEKFVLAALSSSPWVGILVSAAKDNKADDDADRQNYLLRLAACARCNFAKGDVSYALFISTWREALEHGGDVDMVGAVHNLGEEMDQKSATQWNAVLLRGVLNIAQSFKLLHRTCTV